MPVYMWGRAADPDRFLDFASSHSHRRRRQQTNPEPSLLKHLANRGLSGRLIGLHVTPGRQQHPRPRVHDQAQPPALSEPGEDQRARRRLFLGCCPS
jgi:hypothetical protein